MPKISMTGTRRQHKLTTVQLENFKNLMRQYKAQGYTHLNHGDCIGADAIAHDMAVELGLEIIIHPPDDSKYRAQCTGRHVEIMPEKSYRARNQQIVNNGAVLLALSRSNTELTYSGTWMTVRMARKKGIPIVICYPDGRVEWENMSAEE